jgi:hypothetical protein
MMMSLGAPLVSQTLSRGGRRLLMMAMAAVRAVEEMHQRA